MSIESLENVKELTPVEHVSDPIEPLNEAEDSIEQVESPFTPSEFSEITRDSEMVASIGEKLTDMPEIKYENWKDLTLEQRCEVLNRIEEQAAAIEHRPALKVELETLGPRNMGYCRYSENKIVLNSLIVGSNEQSLHREVLDTIFHEGRHAYQHYNVDVKTIHESEGEVASWRENFYDPRYSYYQSSNQDVLIVRNGSASDVNFRLYYYQPVEIDARDFATDVMSQLEKKGIL